MKQYDIINHTADIGIVAHGRSIKELFENAAFAMFDLTADLSNIEPKKSFGFEVNAVNYEELLVAWLRELLYKFAVGQFLFKEFGIVEVEQTHLKGFAKGEKYDSKKHVLKKEIKAVTYHDLSIKKDNGTFSAQIIFDT